MGYDESSNNFIKKIASIDENRKIVALAFMEGTTRQNVQEVLFPILQRTGPIYGMDNETMDNILKQMLSSRNSQIRETTEKSIIIATTMDKKQLTRIVEKERMEYNRKRSSQMER